MTFSCNIPCIVCAPSIGGGVGPVDPANPFVNLSSEEPDFDGFIGRRYSTPWDPPLGSTWYAIGCTGWCISSISQEDADLCAAVQAAQCLPPIWPEPCPTCPPNPPGDPPPLQPRMVFYNTPQACSTQCADGSFYTFTTAAGVFASVINQATADGMAYSYACIKATVNKMCLGSFSPTRTCSNVPFIGSITASTSNTPVSFSVAGDPPDGMLFSPTPNILVMSGTPTIPGNYSFTVTATDSLGQSVERLCTLNVFGVATVELPDGTVDSPYSATLQYGGTPAGTVVWAIAGGILPDGLVLNSLTGEISGTPTTEETQTLNVSVSDGTSTCYKSLGIQIGPAEECADWANDLIFGAPTEMGAVTFTPQAGPSATFSFDAIGDPFAFVGAWNTGTITYNGPGCDCNVHVEVVANTGNHAVEAAFVQIDDNVSGQLLLADFNLNAGSYDYAFSLPDTLGMDHVITVYIQGSLDQDLLGHLQFNGVIENVV